MIAGMDSRNEYRAAVLGEMPVKSAVDMVEPDREMPGMIATPCMMPMRTASKLLSARSVSVLRRRGICNSKPVTISMEAATAG